MKIAIIRKKYTFQGGAETFSHALIQHLADQGHEVHIFAAKWDAPPLHGKISFHKLHNINLTSTMRGLSFAVSAYSSLKGTHFDIIQSHDKTLLQDIYRAGDGCHIEWLRQRWKRIGVAGKLSIVFNPYHWLVLFLERCILNGHRFKKVIAISRLVKENILDHYAVRESDVEVVYNGADLTNFHPKNRFLHRAALRKRYGVCEEDMVALFVGSGFERKGVRYLLDAVDKVSGPLTVLIVGKGPEMSFKDRHGNKRVIFCGPQKDIVPYYAASDVFVFPSIYEPFGNVHFEALASGLPVITTRLSGAAEIIEDGKDGFVVPEPERTEQIAWAIERLMDRGIRAEMSAGARKKAEEFPFSRNISETMGIYHRLLSEISDGR